MATEEQIREFLSQPGLSDAQIASAMVDWNVTPEQVAAATGVATPEVQSRFEAARPDQPVSPSYQDLVTQAYADIGRTGFGDTVSTIDRPGYEYWTGQLQSGAVSPEDFRQQFSGALTAAGQAAPESEYTKYVTNYLIDKAYQDVLGRSAEDQGEEYWKQQLLSGQVSPFEVSQALAKGATGVEDRLRAQQFLGSDYFAPEEFIRRTGGLGYQDIVDYASQNITDPTKVYQAAQQYNVNPNDLVAAMQAKGATQLGTLSDVEKFFQQGQQGFAQRYDQILDETFGNDEEKARIEKILGMKAGDLEKMYGPAQFSRSSLEKIEETLQSTRVNKIQDALITKAIAKDVLGFTDEEMKSAVSDLVSGKEDDPFLKGIFDSLKSGNRMTKDEFERVMSEAAKNNPDAEIFKRNPELKLRYEPIEAEDGVSGQYGYHNNAPILFMPALDRYLKDANQAKIDLAEGDLGWATNSKYLGEVRNGAAVFGVKATKDDLNYIDSIEKIIQQGGGLQTKIIQDPEMGPMQVQGAYVTTYDENGKPVQQFRSVQQLFGYDENTGINRDQQYAETRKQLESAAQKLNIDPRTYGTTKELFNAVQDKAKDLYLVIGRGTQWDPDVAKAAGLTKTDGSRGGINHAAVLYQRVGDKGIALQAPQTFNFDDPNKPSFWQELASVPFVAELALLNPATASFYPAIKGAQSAILGGDIGDIAKNVALSYVGQSVLPQIAPDVMSSIGNTLLEAGVSPDIAGTLADAGARVALNTGMSVLAGADVGEAAERSLINYGVNRGISGGLSLADFPKEFQPEVARLLSEGVMTGNFENAAKNAVMRYGGSQLKNIIKDTSTPTSAGPTLRAARGGSAQKPGRVAVVRRDVRKLIPLRKSGLSYI